METSPMEEEEFVDAHRAELIQRVTMVMAVADELLSQGMLHRERYAEVLALSTRNTTMQAMRQLDGVVHSGGPAVKRAFYTALHKHEPCLLQSLREEVPSKRQKLSGSTCSLLSGYKDWVKSEFENVQEYNYRFGEEVPLSERYVELLIVQEHRERPEREEAIWATGERFQQVRSKRVPTSVEKLFCPDQRSSTPRVVLLQGDSGHGKSFTAQKIVHDWASGTLYADLFDLVLLLRCKELNQVTEMKSFVELLNMGKGQLLTQEMLETASHKLLIVIEGFDELRLSEENTCSSPSDVVTRAPVQAIILGLFKGHLLSDSSLLITARPSAHDRLLKLVKRRPQRFAEILGFAQDSVEKYFRKFFSDEQSFERAFQCVQKNEVLLTSCFIPIICWTVCTILQEKSDEGDDIMRSLETTSSIYLEFLSTMLEHHHYGDTQEGTSLVRSLGQLAESGMLGKKILFDKQSVSRVERDPASNPFLCKILLKKRTSVETFFSFMHLSFQEFFTAVHYALDYETEAQEKVKDLLLKMEPGNPLHKHIYLWPVVQFLFGIANTAPDTDGPIVAMPPDLVEELKSWITRYPVKQPAMLEHTWLFLLHCLCELHDEAFVRSAIEAWGEIHLSFLPLKRSDWWVLRYCLQSRPSIRKLLISHCHLTGHRLKLLLPVLADLPCQELRLNVKSLVDGDIGDIVSTLGKKTGLRSLTLDVDEITNRDGKNVCLDLNFMKTPKAFRFHVRHRLPTEPVEFTRPTALTDPEDPALTDPADPADPALTDPVLTGVYMVLPLGGHLARDWTALLHPMLLLTDLTHGSPGVDEPLSAVIGFLCSVPALQEAELQLSCLTRDWAARIRPLMEACPHIKFVVRVDRLQRYSHGLLLEEGIRALQELHKPPGRSLTVTGRRCNKHTGRCTDPKDLERVCNRPVRLVFKDQSPPEQISLQASIFYVNSK
ncbi:NACHT, LRR and PYD domains-containing protein 1 homolog [Sardina pilchardus]|uniref:NACHT, LRR and PYD domains-containing protein 1 homolog n=1 Tax=Sardina pilchardus TaxID=27697 RepID=UPI002E14AA16